MVIETGSFDNRSQREKREQLPELPIRAHHGNLYETTIFHLYTTQASGLEEFCRDLAQKHTRAVINKRPTLWDDIPNGHRFLDTAGPTTYKEDVIGDDPQQYAEKRAQSYLDFLSKPELTPVRIGSVIDTICQGCAFGNGNGGVHCQRVIPIIETHEANKLFKEVKMFLRDQDLNEKKLSNSPKYEVQKNQVPLVPPMQTADEWSGSKDVTQVRMPLGLLRDVLTYKATRWEDNIFTSYQALLDWKGMSPKKE